MVVRLAYTQLSYRVQDHLLRDGTAHGGLGPSTSVNNKDICTVNNKDICISELRDRCTAQSDLDNGGFPLR